MARVLDLRKTLRKGARLVARNQAVRLEQSRGLRGQVLPPKKRPNGRPLGFKKSATGIPGRLRRSRVSVSLSGFDRHYDLKTQWFHAGIPSNNQVARPIVGITKREENKIGVMLAKEAARQVTKALKGA